MEVRRSVLVSHPVEAMFDLIEQAEHYPRFMPWCVGATILERSDDWVAAKVDFSYAQVAFSLSTRNAKRRPDWLRVRAVDGPFRRFEGDWRLTRLGDMGCRVNFDVDYELSGALLDRLARPTVEFVARTVIDAFVRRADQCCGQPS
jgi:ribosome-associated toxin RatA of RatAB toxin-antitoxin module